MRFDLVLKNFICSKKWTGRIGRRQLNLAIWPRSGHPITKLSNWATECPWPWVWPPGSRLGLPTASRRLDLAGQAGRI